VLPGHTTWAGSVRCMSVPKPYYLGRQHGHESSNAWALQISYPRTHILQIYSN